MRDTLGLAVTLLAACGGPSHDAAPDAGLAGAVRVTVTRGGQTAAGLTVYFLDPDDSVVATALTDGSGQASAPVHAGGSVTVVEPSTAIAGPFAFGLETWLAVRPGDELALELPPPSSLTSFDLTAPADATPGISVYSVIASCGGAQVAPGIAHSFQLSSCTGKLDATDFAVFALDAQGRPTDALVALDTPVANTQPVSLTGPYAPIGSIAVSYTNVPARFVQAAVDARLVTDHGGLPAWNTSVTFAAGGATGAVAWPAQLTTGTQIVSTYVGDTAANSQRLVGWGPVAPAFALDVGSHVLRTVDVPQLDVANHRITWNAGATGAVPDVSLLSFALDHGPQHRFTWTVVAPGSETAVTLPLLPTEIESFRLASSDEGTTPYLGTILGPAGAAYRAAILGPEGLDAKRGVVAGMASGVVAIAEPPSAPLD